MSTSKLIEFDYYVSPWGETYAFTVEDQRHVFEYSGYGMAEVEWRTLRPAASRHPVPYDFELQPRVITLSHRVEGCSRCDYWANAKTISDLLRPNVLKRCMVHTGRLVKRLDNGGEFFFDVLVEQGPQITMSTDSSVDAFAWAGQLRFVAHDPLPKSLSKSYMPLNITSSVEATAIVQRDACCHWDNLGQDFDGTVQTIFTGNSGRMYAVGQTDGPFSGGAPSPNAILYYQDGAWVSIGSMGGNPNHVIHDVVETADGTVYFGGHFDTIGSIAANNVAQWNPFTNTWSDLNGGISNYLAPAFQSNIDPVVYSLAVGADGVSVWAGGIFSSVNEDDVIAKGLTRWEPSLNQWVDLHALIGTPTNITSTVYDIAVTPTNEVYVVGDFSSYYTNFTGFPPSSNFGGADNVIRLTPNSIEPGGYLWEQLGDGLNGVVRVVKLDTNGDLYFGGDFTLSTAAGGPLFYVTRWNGVSYLPISGGVDDVVRDICIDGNELHVVGDFTRAGDAGLLQQISAEKIAVHSGGQWKAIGVGLPAGANLNAVDCSNGLLTLGGDFDGTLTVSGCTQFQSGCSADTGATIVLNGPMTLYSIGNAVNGATISFPPLELFNNEQLIINLTGEIHLGPHRRETRAPTFISTTRGNMERYVLPGSQSSNFIIAGNGSMNSIVIDASGSGSAYLCYRCKWWGPVDCVATGTLLNALSGEPLLCEFNGEAYRVPAACQAEIDRLCAVGSTPLDDACSANMVIC